jgi:predicted DNA-binding transcriptional regulator AlpA
MPSEQALGLRLADPESVPVSHPTAGALKARGTKNQIVVVNSPSLLVDARVLAAILSVSVATIWRMDASGRLPGAVRPSSGAKRWRREEIQEWIDVGCPCRKDWEAMKKANK